MSAGSAVAFVHLDTRTEHSAGGFAHPDELAAAAAALGQPGVAVVDDSLASAWAFKVACQEQGVKPIIGLRLSIRMPVSGGETSGTVSLLVTGERGWSNLLAVANTLALSETATDPLALAGQHAEGLTLLTGNGEDGLLPMFVGTEPDDAAAALARLGEVMGGRVLVELPAGPDGPHPVTGVLAGLASAARLLPVVTGQVRYAFPDHETAFNTWLGAGHPHASPAIGNADRTGDAAAPMRDGATMAGFASRLTPEAATAWKIGCQVSAMIAERAPVDPIPALDPATVLPTLTDDPDDEIACRALDGLNRRFVPWDTPSEDRDLCDAAWRRITDELEVIGRTGAARYLLLAADVVALARAGGILPGPGRGSSVASLVCHYLGITAVDPLRHGLEMTRFLSPGRTDPPDVDIDLPASRVPDLLGLLRDRYGHDQVARIGATARIGHEAAAAISRPHATTLTGRRLHDSVHACGTLITAQPLADLVPVRRHPDLGLTCLWDAGDLAATGLVKLDLLGVDSLDTIDRCRRALPDAPADPFGVPDDPAADTAAWQLLGAGHTAGVFQLAGEGMTRTLQTVAPTCLDELVIAIALFRPGVSAAATEYSRRSGSTRWLDELSLDPTVRDALWPVLSPTRGVIVFQEQVMALSRAVAGFSAAEQSTLRRACTKKDAAGRDSLTLLRDDFIARSMVEMTDRARQVVSPAVPMPVAARLWDQIAASSAYLFARVHAVAYAHVALAMARLKAGAPAEFAAAVLSQRPKPDARSRILDEARARGVIVHPVSVSRSPATAFGRNGELWPGISELPAVGRLADLIVQGRDRTADRGPVSSAEDLAGRLSDCRLDRLPATAMRALTEANAFAATGPAPAAQPPATPQPVNDSDATVASDGASMIANRPAAPLPSAGDRRCLVISVERQDSTRLTSHLLLDDGRPDPATSQMTIQRLLRHLKSPNPIHRGRPGHLYRLDSARSSASRRSGRTTGFTGTVVIFVEPGPEPTAPAAILSSAAAASWQDAAGGWQVAELPKHRELVA